MRINTQQNYLENIRRMVIGKIWVKAMAAAIALATALNACSSDGNGGSGGGGSSTAGTKLKANSGWSDSDNGTDKFGFSALPGGIGSSNGSFRDAGYGYWWSSTEYNNSNAYYRSMDYYGNYVDRDNYGKNRWFSVRCIKD